MPSSTTTPFVTTREAWARRWRIAVAVGVVLGVLGTVVVQHWVERPVVADPRAPKMCQWPRHEGEGMAVIIVGGKTVCAELNR